MKRRRAPIRRAEMEELRRLRRWIEGLVRREEHDAADPRYIAACRSIRIGVQHIIHTGQFAPTFAAAEGR